MYILEGSSTIFYSLISQMNFTICLTIQLRKFFYRIKQKNHLEKWSLLIKDCISKALKHGYTLKGHKIANLYTCVNNAT